MSNKKQTAEAPASTQISDLPTLESLYGGNPDDILNFMGIDAGLKKELQKKGLPWKFIDLTKFRKTGVHRGGWVPYKRETKVDNAFGALFATDPDGYTVRNEMVLAVRNPQLHDYYKNELDKRNKAYSLKNIQRGHANQLRSQGVKADEGYED